MDSGLNKLNNLNNTADTTGQYDKNDIEQNKIMAVLSYISLLVLVPLLAAKESKYARFHANQGLVLLGLNVIYVILSIIFSFIRVSSVNYIWGIPYETSATPWYLSIILWIVFIIIAIFGILGIINAATGKAKELPLIGKFKILK